MRSIIAQALVILAATWAVLWTNTELVRAQTPVDNSWTEMGRLPDSALGVSQDPASPSTLYALGGEGVSRSTDTGATWSLCAQGVRFMRLIAPLEGQSGPALLYAGGPGGLKRSADGCGTWSDVSSEGLLPTSAAVRWLHTHPGNNSVLYAGMGGLGGLFRSIDAGATWQPASRGLPRGAWVTALTSDPQRPNVIYIGVKYASKAHPPAYVYRSTDGGVTWRSGGLGMHLLPNNGGEITGLTWSGNTLLAATSSDGLYASTDRGLTWAPATLPRRTQMAARVAMPGAPLLKPRPLSIRALLSGRDGSLLINTAEGAFSSIDGGRSWQGFGPASARTGAPLLLAFDGGSGRVVMVARREVWGYRMPDSVVSLPSPTPAVAAQAEPTPPPAPPTLSPTLVPPTTTPPPSPTSTPVIVARPPGWLPSDRAEPEDPEVADYFEQTGHNVKYGFRDYWRSVDAVRLLGYPLTEEFSENGLTVQYFERARLEYRDGKIAWGLLGTELTEGEFFKPVRFFPSEDDNVYFGPTQHSVSGPFLEFWREYGGLETFGFPLSESFKEDGSEYQWFERARFEWHPYLPEGNRIVLGQLGKEVLRKRGWIKP